MLCAHAAVGHIAAQTPQQIPIRSLAPVTKVAGTFGGVLGVRQIAAGRVLVNDVVRKRLAVFDSTLTTSTALADTTGATVKYTGIRGLALIPYRGDTTFFVDFESRSLVVVTPDGKLGRTVAAPIARDALNMNGGRADANGRLVYRTLAPVAMIPTPDGIGRTRGPAPDSAIIVRADFNTRKVDTLGRVRIYTQPPPVSSVDASGKRTFRRTENPVPPPIDEWTVLSDGTIVIVRGWDYHVDWIDADGTKRSTPKLPFDWRRLTDQGKRAKIDSARKILDSLTAIGKNMNKVFNVSSSGGVATRGEESSVTIDYVPLDSMGDYVPPLRAGSVKADADGNLWILPTTSSQAKGGLLYDVVNKKGELYERVQLPANRDIIGFGANGVVFLMWRDDANEYRIERTRVLRSGATIRPRPAP